MAAAPPGLPNRRDGGPKTRRTGPPGDSPSSPLWTQRTVRDNSAVCLDRATELSTLLRTWRKRRVPEDFPDHPHLRQRRRRSRHLTIEDAAVLTGVSAVWYRSFESGDPNGYSVAFLERVATTLALSDAERTTMFLLVTGYAPICDPCTVVRISPGVRVTLDAAQWPAYVIDHAGEIIARNAASLRWFPSQNHENSLVHWLFHNPAARHQFDDWNRIALDALAHLRAQHARTPESSCLRYALHTLFDASSEARAMWRQRPQVSHGDDGRTRLVHLPSAPAATEVEVVASNLERDPHNLRLCTLVPVGGYLPEPVSA
jgi:transcriptional regulator with XRE-family HTH domain